MLGLFNSGSDDEFVPEEDLSPEELEQFDFWGTLRPHDDVIFFRSDGTYLTILYVDGGTVVDARCGCGDFTKPDVGEDLREDLVCRHIKQATRVVLHQFEEGVIQTEDKDELPIPPAFEEVLKKM
ncbi:hypothetical protein [Halosimplex sp. J119]